MSYIDQGAKLADDRQYTPEWFANRRELLVAIADLNAGGGIERDLIEE